MVHDKEYHKAYYRKHQEKMRNYQRNYYYKNRDRLIALKKRRVVCGCGATVVFGGLPEHYHSKKHKCWEISKKSCGFKKETNNIFVLTFD